MTTVPTVEFEFRDGNYILTERLYYHSARYNRTVILPVGYPSDGASGPAEDVVSSGWWVHDWFCDGRPWLDGTYTTGWQRSMILHDILIIEGRWCRARTWFCATLAYEGWKLAFPRQEIRRQFRRAACSRV